MALSRFYYCSPYCGLWKDMGSIWSSLKQFNLLIIWNTGKYPYISTQPPVCFWILTAEWIRESRARRAACTDLCREPASSHPSKCTNHLCSHTRCLPKSSVPAQNICAVCSASPYCSQKRGPPRAPPQLAHTYGGREHPGSFKAGKVSEKQQN